MTYLLQVDFNHEGPFGEEMVEAFTDLAKSINEEPGFKWKIWTENEQKSEAGGIYVFENKHDAEKYLDKHSKRMKEFGVTKMNAKIFEINEGLSQITNGL